MRESDGVILPFPIIDPVIMKFIKSPFSFSIISGCPEDKVRLLATPYPAFFTITPSVNGMDGSTSSVNGSSPINSPLPEIVDQQ